jgi:membrane protein YqaA with SNARE-associated domain
LEQSVIREPAGGGELSEEPHRNQYRWVMPAAWAGAGLVIAILVVAAIYLLSQEVPPEEVLRMLGLPGVSVVMFFSSATVLLPAPGLAAVIGAGASNQWGPWMIGLAAGFGSSVGELTGYLVGLGGRKMLHIGERSRWMRRGEYFMRRWGFLTVLVMASVPNPVFDAVGILAGSLGYSWRRLWIACMIGITVKYTVIALTGETLFGPLLRLFSLH